MKNKLATIGVTLGIGMFAFAAAPSLAAEQSATPGSF